VLLLAAIGSAQSISGKVIGVSDGDTLTLLTADRRSVRVRMHGIDAPESRQPFGARAKQRLSELAYGKPVTVRVIETDQYGRSVGVVYSEDAKNLYSTIAAGNLNHILVHEGLAWWYRSFARGDRELERLESGAQVAKRGLWAEPGAIAPWEWRRQRR